MDVQKWQLKEVINNRLISTVHLDWGHYEEIETMIFECDADGNVENWSELYCQRYFSDEEAIEGHALILQKVRNGQLALGEGSSDEE